MKVAAVIVAAGRGQRVGGETPKQYLTLGDKTVLYHTVKKFLNHPQIDRIVVAIHPDDVMLYNKAIGILKLMPPVYGGETRQQSVLCGLEALVSEAPDIVLIHDAARPLLSEELISRTIETAKTKGSALPALPVADTLKRVENDLVSGTVDRTNLWRAQTPQAFNFTEILEGHRTARGMNLTDDVAVAEFVGLPVAITDGEERNFKITSKEDLEKAELMIGTGQFRIRTGQGFDVHAFEEGDAVILGGVKIPHSRKLKGHSDADVALHALTDALLGAIAAGDIGDHFPPSDDKWKGAPSDTFLKEAVRLVEKKGGEISSLDLTIICEAPKIGPHREAMRRTIAEICGLDADLVSVKATTTEKLGFTGRGEGIAAQAIATVMVSGK
ncbi:bifunctional 2-C-methyl-D-erythritol 4-phosphate cytidylyltransferase/2-C-methyl-D-erythritol 2,4-cyclodiphosphate synthase [Emcibacter nanhaiensis]|uniref:Bifunctional enzyme IspD/IspF n=1 Tax=Emcibacter nanhaiensis TaxID=1505037 RepID=A0A501PS42_9PROT|nr:bifunctional 2-C-methyl-D-erythritol 4-phosphate cytidylyltransferase/2-C-methyl-D-erythritol 2,4-cyclodiphosphate synthase [Emcibacter nanhaiensis]TPD63055.1 bifunctional 2-C-methyl-D-erythritol 4-phosphate cytidylyltransferase/2-C-methyl-D-erythritol 2,4-cyclodiphosphate synthase [Emcibacter nanhaiensis]